jgi:hypothetical protein
MRIKAFHFKLIMCLKYRAIKKSLCTWWLQYRKLHVLFKVSPASLQTFIGTRLTLTPSVIHNSNHVIMVKEWNCLKYFCVFLYCNHQLHRDVLITLYLLSVIYFFIYRDRPHVSGHDTRTLNELKTSITVFIRNISQADLLKVFANKFKPV